MIVIDLLCSVLFIIATPIILTGAFVLIIIKDIFNKLVDK